MERMGEAFDQKVLVNRPSLEPVEQRHERVVLRFGFCFLDLTVLGFRRRLGFERF